MAIILKDDVIGMPETVGELIEILKSYPEDMPVSDECREGLEIRHYKIKPDEDEFIPFSEWVSIDVG